MRVFAVRTTVDWIATLARCAAWACVAWTVAGSPAPAQDLAVGENRVLQQRLTDAGCYTGAIDGKASEALTAAKQACPDQEPVLRIETGMHVAAMKAIDVDASCRLALTGSDDKTARLWSLADGRLLRVFRTPIGPGNGGKIFAAALSPDGRWVAVGGWDAQGDLDHRDYVYVFDAASGALVARVGDFSDIITHLTFSRDGRWLAATGGPLQGVRVFDTQTWRVALDDRSYRPDASSAAFGPDGRLFVVSLDGTLRPYGPGPTFARQRPVSLGHIPYSVAVDPQGAYIAVGFLDLPSVALIDAHTLRLRYLTAAVNNGNLDQVAWSATGDRLAAGGLYQYPRDPSRPFVVVTFGRDGRQIGAGVNLADNVVSGLAACGDYFVAAAFERGFGIIDRSGAIGYRPTFAADLRDKVGDAFTISPDATKVRLGMRYGAGEPALLDPLGQKVADSPAPVEGFLAPRVDGLPIAHWQNEFRPTFAGAPLGLNGGEQARSLAISPRGDGFVIGTAFRLRAYDARGGARWDRPAPGDAWGVNMSADGRLIVAAFGDGTVRWRRWSDGEEVLAMFVDVGDRRWIAWTPSGYYMASPGAEDLIGWQVNRGWDQPPDFFPASRFRDRFSRPDIVRLALETLDEGEAVRRADEIARRHEDPTPLTAKLPPVVRIADVPGQFAIPHAKLGYGLRAPSGLAVDRIDILIDGRPAKEIGRPLKPLDANKETLGSLEIDLPPRDLEVGLIAWSGEIASEGARVKLSWTGPKPVDQRVRKLHALVAGISDYASPEMALGYAAKDARDFAAALQRQKGGYYSDVDVELLVDREVTRASLVAGLEWLEKQTPGEDDVSVLFLAGHGLTDEKQTYWFLPSDAGEDEARAKGVSQAEIRETLQGLSGKVLWFLDTCHAGGATRPAPVDVTELVNRVTSAESGGIVAFASSTGREVSVESSTWNNGAFTKAIVEAIDEGKADLLGDGKITTSQLDAFVAHRVGDMTDQKQHPVMGRPPQEPDFEIAQARKP
jgi:WD40 repeat protein